MRILDTSLAVTELTNPAWQPKVQAFVRSKWFPGLGLTHHATWAWLKLTAPEEGASPDMLVPWGDLTFRRPYELLFIGSRDDSCTVPKHHLIMSVPLGHSCKPYVSNMLCPEGSAVVELFARHVSCDARWHISVGDEAVRGNEEWAE